MANKFINFISVLSFAGVVYLVYDKIKKKEAKENADKNIPPVTLVSVDWQAGTAILSINGMQVTISFNNTFANSYIQLQNGYQVGFTSGVRTDMTTGTGPVAVTISKNGTVVQTLSSFNDGTFGSLNSGTSGIVPPFVVNAFNADGTAGYSFNSVTGTLAPSNVGSSFGGNNGVPGFTVSAYAGGAYTVQIKDGSGAVVRTVQVTQAGEY